MKIAVVGAGFCGLAVCWHLLKTQKCEVTLFDAKGIGAGASGVATGLLHPYPGEQARGSWNAQEAMQATLQLLKVAEEALQTPVASYLGIVRLASTPKQLEAFSAKVSETDEFEKIGPDAFLIKPGITVNTSLYMQGLWQACKSLGACLEIASIEALDELKAYDRVVLTVGAGIVKFNESSSLRLNLIKGQALTCFKSPSLLSSPQSIIAQAYFAMSPQSDHVQIGATYERQFVSTEPCLKTALSILKAKAALFFPELAEKSILCCSAGIRVMNRDHYMPLLEKLTPTCWALTGMGSRGLLYHAYFAEQLVTPLNEGSSTGKIFL